MAKSDIEFYQFITPDGHTYELHDLETRALLSIEGTGMPKIDYITQKGPFQHGETVLDYRLRPRTIQAVIRHNAPDRARYWSQRSGLIDALRPNRQFNNRMRSGRLRVIYLDENQDYQYRDINVWIERGPEFSARDPETWDEFGITETIRFIAPDPTFYNPQQVCADWTLVLQNRLTFPETWPLIFGQGIVDSDLTINYSGSWLTYPVISILGPARGCTITNTTTGKKIRIQYGISAGETLSISLSYGQKTILSDTGKNLIGTLAEGSDLTTFAIEPDPTATNGVNVIKFQATGCDANTTASLGYYTRYIGI